ncbi:7,8-dihydro-6-hydroxymethylpterin dimethyltransferase [uncultured archaeon]|nr:7,8-dihydro-6-hydroxymethylpterin dimethyltransferase [uncultured archaeon]
MLEEKVNWLITLRCNENCSYCFRPGSVEEYQDKILFAKKIADAKLKKVTISGGEPTIIEDLPEILKILHDSGAYVSLHTNGRLLTPKLVESFGKFIDDVAIPVDSVYPEVQRELRPKGSVEIFDRAHDLLLSSGINVGVHTVVTPLNIRKLNSLYNHVNKKDFKYWKFYQEENAASKFGDSSCDVESFLSDFVLTWRNMKRRLNDPRVSFVASHNRMPYVFLKPNGEISYVAWFEEKMHSFGNLARGDLRKFYGEIEKHIGSQNDADKFFEGRWSLPLWVRLSGIETDPELSKMQLDGLTKSERRKFWRLAHAYEEVGE